MSAPDHRAILEWSLRRTDQLAVALIVTGCGAVLMGTIIWQTVLHRRWIDIERDVGEPKEFLVDLNQADWPELALLPSIGETVARNVVHYRVEHGPFRAVEDLLRVPGIGAKTLERLRPHLIIDSATEGSPATVRSSVRPNGAGDAQDFAAGENEQAP